MVILHNNLRRFVHCVTLTDEIDAAQFVLELLKQRPLYATDKINGKDHYISPPMLANRVMVAREALAGGMSKFDFPTYMARTNTEVYRKHLESSSYTSGSYAKAERRRRQQP